MLLTFTWKALDSGITGGSIKVQNQLNIQVEMGKTQLYGLKQKHTEEIDFFKVGLVIVLRVSGEWSKSEPVVC